MKPNRILTLVVEITNFDQAEWIWENHMGQDCHGIKVNCITNGDLAKDGDNLEDTIAHLQDRLQDE